jgi:hypothetical protein
MMDIALLYAMDVHALYETIRHTIGYKYFFCILFIFFHLCPTKDNTVYLSFLLDLFLELRVCFV